MAHTNLPQVKRKLDGLVTEVQTLRQALKEAEQRLAEVEAESTTKDNQIAALQTELSNRNIAEAVVGTNGNTSNEAKQKITELMREIDRCIALLNV